MIFAYEVAMRCLCFAMEPMQMEKLLSIWGVGGSQSCNSLFGALLLQWTPRFFICIRASTKELTFGRCCVH
ncbi:hypothetical protein POPTR_002G093450v4 [Populus trichocarpa]|uniref:Uncharacterized protein n=1 Tax=Populus trichocarpa TaxID=3694 RepID=A0ACC0TD37_POPTR|nr:hypothetical protein POPTR_002G093450v4 [Populus trichocarpa]